MKTIHKFTLKHVAKQTVDLPHFSRVLSVQAQGADICMWVELVPSEDKYPQEVFIVGTGHKVPNEVNSYLGTTQQNGFVWHIYLGEYPN